MKVVCISEVPTDSRPLNNRHITLGKTYETGDAFDDDWLIIDDYGVESWFDKRYFKPLDEVRQEKLESIGI